MSERRMCYVGIKACGCCVAASVDVPELAKDNANAVAEWIRDGLRVERKPVEWARRHLLACPHQPQQKALAP